MIVLDQYRMQEVAYGHAGFLGAPAWSVLPLAWLEHNLMTPVTSRYAAARPVEIAYDVKGRWVDSTSAAKAGSWQRVRVRYDNGMTILANGAAAPLRAGALTLPQFGWMASGAGVTAYTALRDSVVVDYAETKDMVFANARNAGHWNVTGVRRIRPEVAGFEQIGPRAFRASYRWHVGEKLDRDYRCFVHFTRPGPEPNDEGIRFQQDHPLLPPSSQWKPGATVEDGPYAIRVPDEIADGDYGWTVGLYVPGEGRVTMEGVDDGHGRIRLGTLHVRDSGRSITFTPEPAAGPDRLRLYREHLNEAGKPIDFGTLRTDGSVRVRRDGAEWVLQTLPRSERFTLELSAHRFGRPSRVRSVGGASAVVTPGAAGLRWTLPLNGAREYRWAIR